MMGAEVGEWLAVSTQRVAQIEKRALDRLRRATIRPSTPPRFHPVHDTADGPHSPLSAPGR